jgi:tetratricopeptide (TPR) repeat protein
LSETAGEGRARLLLGVGRYFAGDYEGALREFQLAVKLNPYDEYRKLRITALALSALGRHNEAIAAAESLRAAAREADQRDSAVLTLQDVQRAKQQAAASNDPDRARNAILSLYTPLEGVLTSVDCLGERARFWIRSGAVNRKLIIADPAEVVTGPEGTALEFGCGEQRRGVVIGYVPEADTKAGTEGRIRYLEFK